MRTQIRETQNGADTRNGRVAVMLHNGEDITEFLSRMSRAVTPMGCGAVADNEAKPRHYSAFLSRPAWITTGVFKVAALMERPCETHTGYEAFLSGPTWIRTGVFGLIKIWDGSAVPDFSSVFDGTWITTGAFEVAALTKGPAFSGISGRYDTFLSASTWLRTGVFALTGHKKMVAPIATSGRYRAFLSLPSWITTGVFRLNKVWDDSAVPDFSSVFDGTWITTGAFEPAILPEPSERSLRLAA